MRPSILWLTALAASTVGYEVYLVTLAWTAVQVTTPTNVGLILLAGALPQVLVMLIGGVLVDRLGPKPVIVSSDLLRTFVMVVLVVILAVDAQISPWLLAGLAVAFAVVDGFFEPAVASAPRYLGDVSISRLSAARAAVWRTAGFVGAPLASWLLVVSSAAAAFSVNAALFAVSVVLLSLTRMVAPRGLGQDTVGPPDPPPRRSLWADLTAGMRLIRRRPVLTRLLLIVFVMEIGFAGPTTVGVPLLADETGWGVRAVGWILGGFGLGSGATATLLAARRPIVHRWRVMVVGLTLMGSAVAALGVLPVIGLDRTAAGVAGGEIGLVAGVGAGLLGPLVHASILQLAPDDQVGRVTSVLTLVVWGANPLTFALTGVLTSWAGAQIPFLAGGALVLVAATLLLLSPQVRQLTDTPEPRPSAVPGVGD